MFAVDTCIPATAILNDTTAVVRTDTLGAIGGITTAGGTMVGTIRTHTTGIGGTDGAIGHIVTLDGKLLQHFII